MIREQNDGQNHQENNRGQRVDLRADLLAGHAVNGDGKRLQVAAGKIGNDEIVNKVAYEVSVSKMECLE